MPWIAPLLVTCRIRTLVCESLAINTHLKLVFLYIFFERRVALIHPTLRERESIFGTLK